MSVEERLAALELFAFGSVQGDGSLGGAKYKIGDEVWVAVEDVQTVHFSVV